MTKEQIEGAAKPLKNALKEKLNGLVPELAVVLGSGLGSAFSSLKPVIEVPFTSLPGFPEPTVEGHSGSYRVYEFSGKPVLVQMGRIHFYEGFSPQLVALPIRVLKEVGASRLLLTNAAGGLKAEMAPGELMVITDHINLTGQNPLIGKNDLRIGPRFPDMTKLYQSPLTEKLIGALKNLRLNFHEGVYCGVSGPCYESAAEIRYLGLIGGSAVGMSTVLEAIAARHCGLEIAGLSAITNLGTGLSKEILTHEDVQVQSAKNSLNLVKIISALV